MVMIGHSMLLRGDNVRRIEFADMWAVPLDEEQPNYCLIINLMGTKTSADVVASKSFGVAIRNKSVTCCAVGTLALYFFLRFNQEQLPSFKQSSTWFNVKLFRGKSPTDQITATSHRSRIKKIIEATSIKSIN